MVADKSPFREPETASRSPRKGVVVRHENDRQVLLPGKPDRPVHPVMIGDRQSSIVQSSGPFYQILRMGSTIQETEIGVAVKLRVGHGIHHIEHMFDVSYQPSGVSYQQRQGSRALPTLAEG